MNRHMFWSHPKPCANSMGCVPFPKTFTLLRASTSVMAGRGQCGVVGSSLCHVGVGSLVRGRVPARWRWRLCARWQYETERAPLARFGFDLEHALQHLGETARDGQPESRAFSELCLAELHEFVEDLFAIGLRDALALVDHLEHDTTVFPWHRSHANRLAVPELDRVGQEI